MDGRDLAIDRISNLSDYLISEILSLLKNREAVQTCILSKRWTNIWTSVATLDFNNSISEFDHEDKFLRFVHGVLNSRGFSPLDTFKLTWRFITKSKHRAVDECINHAVACMPRMIYINMHTHYVLYLPDSLFNCGSVKEMSLISVTDYHICEHQLKSINLPSLQKLELGHMHIGDRFIKMLLLGCSVLEELVLDGCMLTINEINSNMLKKLTTHSCLFSSCTKSITLKNMSSLVTADLEIMIYNGLNELNLLGGLSNVTSLRFYIISHNILGLLDKNIQSCPRFSNLKTLELGLYDTIYGWNLVACFLQHSPNLKKLVLNFRHSDVIVQEKISSRREFLEIVEIRFKIESEETVRKVVATLGALVKTIGKIIII